MSLWERHFHAPVIAARPFLMVRATLLLLATDLWALMAPHGSRYGVRGYNLAQFSVLDALGVPTPGRFLATVFLAGVVAMTAAIATPNAPSVAVVAGLYTWAWSMSMLTAWQHYYLLSILLVCFVFIPRVGPGELVVRVASAPTPPSPAPEASRARSRKKPPRPPAAAPAVQSLSANLIPAWGFRLATTNIALVYVFTAFSKTEGAWRRGLVLQMIDQQNGALGSLRSLAAAVGVGDSGFFHLMGLSTIGLQLLLAAAYLLSSRLDDAPSRAFRWFCLAAAALAVSFHLGTDALGLKIGWFSRYMIVVALTSLLPGSWLVAFARLVADPLDALCTAWRALDHSRASVTLGLGLASASALGLSAWAIDLPGAPAALWGLAAVVVVASALGPRVGRGELARRYAVSAAAAVAAMWLTLAAFDVRYDYYRFLGADEQRVGAYERALAAYQKAERYAPRGESRRDKIDALEAMIEARRSGQQATAP